MASSQRTIDYLLEQAAGAGVVSARRMFGEYAVYCGEAVVGLVCDDELFLKPTDAGRQCLDRVVEGVPYPGAKPHLRIGADYWEDPEFLARLIRTTAAALPARKPPARGKAGGAAKAKAKPSAAKPRAGRGVSARPWRRGISRARSSARSRRRRARRSRSGR